MRPLINAYFAEVTEKALIVNVLLDIMMTINLNFVKVTIIISNIVCPIESTKCLSNETFLECRGDRLLPNC